MMSYLLDGRWPTQLFEDHHEPHRRHRRKQRRRRPQPFHTRTKLFAAGELLWQMRQHVHADRESAIRLTQTMLRRMEEDLVATVPGAVVALVGASCGYAWSAE